MSLEAVVRGTRGESYRPRGRQPGGVAVMSVTKSGKRPRARGPFRYRRVLVLSSFFAVAFGATYAVVALTRTAPASSPEMVWIPGGEFTMGTDADSGLADE